MVDFHHSIVRFISTIRNLPLNVKSKGRFVGNKKSNLQTLCNKQCGTQDREWPCCCLPFPPHSIGGARVAEMTLTECHLGDKVSCPCLLISCSCTVPGTCGLG